MAQIFGKLGNRMRKLMGRMDQYQEAITFAEAGQPEHVQELLMTGEGEGEERTAAKLHVVTHVVKFSGPNEALEEMKKEYGDIEFVISEAQEDQLTSRVEEGERARQDIFVYTMV